jgi:multisubunit Na+/H+ antiporter MnhG subunit
MILRDISQALLLFAAVAIVLMSCLGLLLGDSFDRLHYLGPATVLAPVLIAAAVAIRYLSAETVIKAVLLAIAFFLSSPVLTHATGVAGLRHHRDNSRNEDDY